jgi:ribulose-bisphosphate carboxylase small chain
MRITQGTFSFLPDFTDEEIEKQIKYALSNDWAMMVEYTDDPHPRNYLWEMWRQPNFDLDEDETGPVMDDINGCRKAYPNHYIKLVAYDPRLGAQTSKLAFIVNRPEEEPGYRIERQETHDRTMNYTLRPYVLDEPSGRRYGNEGTLTTEPAPSMVQEATPGPDSPEYEHDTAAAGQTPEAESDEGIGES